MSNILAPNGRATVTVPAADEEEADYVPGSPYDEVFEELERSAREEKTTGFVKK